MARAIRINPADNVATLLDDAAAGAAVAVLGADGLPSVTAGQPVALGHKIALQAIPAGGAVVKFGVPIGSATAAVRPGDWVHLHNCGSGFDERSGTLDVHSGATTDTKYE